MEYIILNVLDIITTGMLVIVVILLAYQQYAAPNKNRQSDFVSIASHQLRTPLTIMRGYLAMLLGGDFGAVDNKRQQAAITAVYQANERLLRLVDNLLGVSQLEGQGTLMIECQKFDLLNMIREVVKEIKQRAAVKNLEIKTVLPKTIPALCADEILLRQVILNLIDNAIKYTERGTITLSVKTDKNNLSLSVEDTGPGINPKEIKHIFDKFERRDVPHSSEEGFGLGLYAAKLIIEAHKGRIWAETRGQNFGFRVLFEIPLA